MLVLVSHCASPRMIFQGQRVDNPVKGVYIKNGKKIIYK